MLATQTSAEARLALLETLLQNTPIGFAFVDHEFRFVEINDVLAISHGLSVAEHVGKTVAQVVPELWAALEPWYRRALAGETVLNQDFSGSAADGRLRHWLLSYYPVRLHDHVIGLGLVVNDVSELRDAEAQVTATRARLAAIVESSRDAIIGRTLDGTITTWNSGAEQLYGFTAREMCGTSIACLIPADRQDEEAQIIAKLQRAEPVEHFETLRQTRDGRLLSVSVTVSPIRSESGLVVGVSSVARDMTAVREREREIARLSRLYGALSQINRAIACATTRDSLLGQICQALVEQGGFRMSWIGWHRPETRTIEPIAAFGDESDYVNNISVYSDDRPEGRGPSGTAFREGRPYICNDFLTDDATLPFRAEAARRRFRASAVFPIRENAVVSGVLSVYAEEPSFFRDKETALLVEVANNLSFALDNLAREEARKKAEQTLRQERDFSDAVLNSLPGVLYLYDQKGKFIRWNANFERVTGYSAAEIATLRPLDLFSAGDKALVESRIQEVFEKGASSVEADLLSKDGRNTRYYFTGVAMQRDSKTCLVGVGIDIEQRKVAELARQASDARYRVLFEYAPDGIVIADGQSYCLDANESVCKMLGYTRDELIGLHATDIVVPTEAGQSEPDLDPIKSRADHHSEWLFRRKDASVFPAEVIATMMPDGNLLGMIRDISERKAAETALHELNETLEQKVVTRTAESRDAARRAEAADALKSAFLATMSHELRTPLNSIIGFTGILAQGMAGPLNPEQAKQLGMVRGSARHLLELINDVLDLSKIEANQLEVHAERFDARASLERVVALVKPLAEKKGLALVSVVSPAVQHVMSDRRRLEQVVLNLLNNAIKFTERGTVTLHAEVEAGQLRVQVMDSGIGIKAQDLDTLFKPFQQIDTGLTRQHEGTGLGLAICRRLASLLGGDISVRSEWSKGSVFTFTLPLAEALSA